MTLFTSIVSPGDAVVGALVGGASGAAWGLATASFIGAAAFLRASLVEAHLYRTRAETAASEAPAPH